MEDAYRTHKGDAEFGWVLLVKQVWRGLKRRNRERELAAWRESRYRARARSRHVLDDLHSPAGPH